MRTGLAVGGSTVQVKDADELLALVKREDPETEPYMTNFVA